MRAYAYTGLDPDNENQRNFHDFLRRSNYKVVSKDIRKYGDGKVKANLDIELVVDMMKTARNLDIAIVVSGDGDFAPAIRAVQEQGVRVEVISFRGNTSSDLIEVADLFTDITQLAKVERGSRSGRRVAEDDADLSMTEVPDKQTEGTGFGRGARGGRGRGAAGRRPEPATTNGSGRGGRGGRGGGRSTTTTTTAESGAGLVALPGERLSRGGGSLTEADLAAAEVFTLDDLDATAAPEGEVVERVDVDVDAEDAENGGRRRRRRGGRGRGRGRGRDEVRDETAGPVAAAPGDLAPVLGDVDEDELDEDELEPVAPRGPKSTPFGSVWDSQIGTPASPSPSGLAPLADDEDFDEPEIPEYLIAEQRRGQAARGGGGQRGRGGPRGGRAAYQSAIDRERYGGGGGGGINRYPDVSARTGSSAPRDDRGPARSDRAPAGRDRDRDRGPRPVRRDDRPRDAAPRSSSSEPWSEVPPELEAMLRAQVAAKPAGSDAGSAVDEAPELEAVDLAASEPEAKPRSRTTRTTRSKATAAAAPEGDGAEADAEAKPKRRTTRAKAADAAPAATADVVATEADAEAKPKRRTTRAKAADTAPAEAADAVATEADAEAKPKRRTTRKTAAATDAS